MCYSYAWHHLVKVTEVTADLLKVMAAYCWVDGLKSVVGPNV